MASERSIHWHVLFIVVALAAFSLWTPNRGKPPDDEGTVVRVGVMLREMDPRRDDVDRFVTELAREEINRHCADEGLGVSFEFVYSYAAFNCDSGVLQLEAYHEDGVDLVIGATYNINLHCGAPIYARDNGMVLVCPTLTSNYWDYAFNGSYPLFRLSHTENAQVKPILALMERLGMGNVVVLTRADESGTYDWIRVEFEEGFEARGWSSRRFGYMYNGSDGDFTPFLERVISHLEGLAMEQEDRRVGVILVESSDEFEYLIDQAVSYPVLANITWFTNSKSSHWPYSEFYRYGGDYSRLRLYSPILKDPDNDVYRGLNRTFSQEFDRSLGLEGAYIYDSCWILAESVLEAGSVNGTDVAGVVRDVASDHRGASGLFLLNEDGERAHVDYEYRAFFEGDGLEYMTCGFYNGTSGDVTWYEGFG